MSSLPTSDLQGKDWTAARITELKPDVILDIGPGEGTYAGLLRPSLPDALFVGLEIWEPYVVTYGLDELYDEILVGDARRAGFPLVDVVVMGDVLEHMSHPDALVVWTKARAAATMAVFASIPIIHCPQLEYPNPHEQHVHTWSHDLAMQLPGVSGHWLGSVIGCYTAPGLGAA